MCRLDLDNMSLHRKIGLTVVAVLYGLAMLGNARLAIYGCEGVGNALIMMTAITLFFVAASFIVILWTKK